MTIADTHSPERSPVVIEIVDRIGAMPGVTAIAIAGSIAAGHADAQSDIDLYVYSPEPPPLDLRAALALQHDPHPEIDNQAFGPGDEWTIGALGIGIDIMYWSPEWIEQQVARVLDQHLAATGYTTSFWYTVIHSQPVFDPTGWFAGLQRHADQTYPEPLRRAIVSLNHPLLRSARSSYRYQIERAMSRDDANSVQHRTAALLASYFDVLFALNRVPHPGEKRLVSFATRECPLCPPNLSGLVGSLIAAVPPLWSAGDVLREVDALVDALDTLLRDEGLLS